MIFKTYSVFCDHVDCSQWIGQEVARAGNSGSAANAVRSYARKKGWKRTDGRDLCPRHTDSEA